MYDWDSRLPVNAGVGLEFIFGDKQADHFSVRVGQDWIYNGVSGDSRFDSRLMVAAKARFAEYFTIGAQVGETNSGHDAWKSGAMGTSNYSVYAGISIPILGGDFGSGKKSDELPPTYDENIRPIQPPPSLKPGPVTTPVSSQTVKAKDGSDIQVEVKKIAGSEENKTGNRLGNQTGTPDRTPAENKADRTETRTETNAPNMGGPIYPWPAQAARTDWLGNPLGTPARTQKAAPRIPYRYEDEVEAVALAPAPEIKKAKIQEPNKPAPKAKTLAEQQLEFNKRKIEKTSLKSEGPGGKLVFGPDGIAQALAAAPATAEDGARYDYNKKKTMAGNRVERQLKDLAAPINESPFGKDYKARFGIDIVNEDRTRALEHQILGGGQDPGTLFYKTGDAQIYIDRFLTPLHQYLQGIGIETQVWVGEMKAYGQVIGMQVHLVLPQEPAEIDRLFKKPK
jgi:hypothetical protein